jgi:hypothetical protein
MMMGFETAPLQRRKQEGTNIGVLLYHFDECSDSRENECDVKIMGFAHAIPYFICRFKVQN